MKGIHRLIIFLISLGFVGGVIMTLLFQELSHFNISITRE
jgi:hypothetical protein